MSDTRGKVNNKSPELFRGMNGLEVMFRRVAPLSPTFSIRLSLTVSQPYPGCAVFIIYRLGEGGCVSGDEAHTRLCFTCHKGHFFDPTNGKGFEFLRPLIRPCSRRGWALSIYLSIDLSIAGRLRPFSGGG